MQLAYGYRYWRSGHVNLYIHRYLARNSDFDTSKRGWIYVQAPSSAQIPSTLLRLFLAPCFNSYQHVHTLHLLLLNTHHPTYSSTYKHPTPLIPASPSVQTLTDSCIYVYMYRSLYDIHVSNRVPMKREAPLHAWILVSTRAKGLFLV